MTDHGEAGPRAGGTDALGAWRRLCPLGRWPEPTLAAIEERLREPDVARALREAERSRRYPRDVIRALQEVGLAELFADDRRATAHHVAALNAITARTSGSLAIAVGVNGLAMLPIQLAGSPAQRARAGEILRAGGMAALLLTEWDSGSDLGRIATTARPADGGYTLTGRKDLINGGSVAELLVVLARTADDEEPEATGPFGAARTSSVFMLERADVAEAAEPLPRWDTLPAPAADISGVRFRRAFAPASALVGPPGDGFGLVQRTLTLSRGGIGSLAAGASQRAFDLASEHAWTRRLYGGPLVALGAIRGHLLRLAACNELASALAVKAAATMNAHGQGAAYTTAAAKAACCELAEEAVDEGRRVLGARALVHERPYAQLVRDVPLYGVFDGTRHVMLDHLQREIARAAARPEDGSDPLEPTRQALRCPPRPLAETPRRRTRWPSPRARARALAALDGAMDLEPAAQIAAGLLELAGGLRGTRRGRSEQGPWFEIASIGASLEALLALAELSDPVRRDALGARPRAAPSPLGDELASFAVAHLGARLAGRLGELGVVLEHSFDADVEAARRVSLRAADEASARLHASLRPNDEPMEKR